LRISTDLAPSSLVSEFMPVTFAPGRARLATRPKPTGSGAAEKTIGSVAVASFAARAEGVPPAAKIRVTPRPTSSAASAGSFA